MIIRVFQARVRPGKHEQFERFIKERVIPMIGKHNGLVAEYAGRPYGSNSSEFTNVSVWKSLSDLKAFAGTDWEASLLNQEELDLIEDTSLHHFELFYQDIRDRGSNSSSSKG